MSFFESIKIKGCQLLLYVQYLDKHVFLLALYYIYIILNFYNMYRRIY